MIKKTIICIITYHRQGRVAPQPTLAALQLTQADLVLLATSLICLSPTITVSVGLIEGGGEDMSVSRLSFLFLSLYLSLHYCCGVFRVPARDEEIENCP